MNITNEQLEIAKRIVLKELALKNRAYKAEWREKNREKIKVYNKKYYNKKRKCGEKNG